MEPEEIAKFLHGYGYGDGSGYGDGYGSGSGSGSGYGDGDGSGYGYGDGSGYGYGYGSGSGYGYGDGSGYGYGDGSGYGFKIKRFKNQVVHYVDGLPCLIDSVHGDFARIRILNRKDFTETEGYLARYGSSMAHGKTIREALDDAMEKYLSGIGYEEKKRQLLDLFRTRGKLPVKELYMWHGILTGSCRLGRSHFQEEHGLSDDDLLTLDEFVELTRDSFGGDRICGLKEYGD